MGVVDLARRAIRPLGVDVVRHRTAPPDFTDAEVQVVRTVAPYTMTSPERVFAASTAAAYVVDARLPGAVVECGVWRGGSAMAMAMALLARGESARELYLFDTFEGMTAPSAQDVDYAGKPARQTFERTATGPDSSSWCLADLADVRTNLARTGYPHEHVHYVPGKVEDTLPAQAPDQIALLRLDTDWYASTQHELETLYPRLVSGGVLIVDDYGHWKGSRQAVDEYFEAYGITVLLSRIDDTGRMAVKP